MEIFLFCVAITMIAAMCLFALGFTIGSGGKNERDTKDCTKCGCNNSNILRTGGDNMRDRVMGDYNEAINSGQDMGLEDKAEKAIIRLNRLRTGTTRSEQEAIDFATECIEVRMRLEKFFKERGV